MSLAVFFHISRPKNQSAPKFHPRVLHSRPYIDTRGGVHFKSDVRDVARAHQGSQLCSSWGRHTIAALARIHDFRGPLWILLFPLGMFALLQEAGKGVPFRGLYNCKTMSHEFVHNPIGEEAIRKCPYLQESQISMDNKLELVNGDQCLLVNRTTRDV